MKILHIITLAELGGAQSVVLNLAKESISEGHQVMVASSEAGELWHVLPPDVLQWKIGALCREINIVADCKVISELRKLDKLFEPDVVHLHSSKMGILGRIAFPAAKIIYTVHGFDSIRVAFRKFLPIEKVLQTRSRYIVGVSEYDRQNLIKEGISNNVTSIYNGIIDYAAFEVYAENRSLREAREKMQSVNGFKILCIARISPQKKFHLFCEVASQMQNYDIQFFWVGNKEPMHGLPANLHCLGQVENAHSLLKYTDIFILPTNYEGMPMSIIESFCYGTPVIASNVGGIPEMLDGKNGRAVENNATAFIAAILLFSQNKKFLTSAKLEARNSFERNFTVRKMFAAYMDLYQSMVPAPSLVIADP